MRPSRWSQSPCVHTRPDSSQPACASTIGSASCSSGRTGESITKHSAPRWTSVHVVCQNALRRTMTSAWTLTTCTVRLCGAEQLRRLEEVLDLRGRLLLPGVELLPVAVHPDDRDLLLQARLDVVVVARGDVDPPLLGADAPRALGEVGRVGLVGPDLLGRHDEVEVERHVAAGEPEQLVVDVRDEPRLELVAELLELRDGLLERRPALDRVRQEAGAGRLERPADVLGDAHGDATEDLGVELVRAALDLALVLVEAGDDLVAIVDREPVLRGLAPEGVVHAGLPVDQRAVDVEGDEGDLGGKGHERGHSASCPGPGGVRPGSWHPPRRAGDRPPLPVAYPVAHGRR